MGNGTTLNFLFDTGSNQNDVQHHLIKNPKQKFFDLSTLNTFHVDIR